MSKVAVIYWSATGNTEAMAKAIAEKAGGDLFNVSSFNVSDLANYDSVALGCPSMGNEVLEESEFEPFTESVKASLVGKKVALFGSYGWGDGEWMRNWKADFEANGISLTYEPVIACGEPDASAIVECESLASSLI